MFTADFSDCANSRNCILALFANLLIFSFFALLLYRDSILVTHYMATARVAISGKYCIDVFFHSPIQKLHAINTQTTFRIVFDCEDFLQFPSEKLCLKIYYSLCLLHKKHIALLSISCRILLGLGWSPLLPIFFSYTYIYLNTVHILYNVYTDYLYISFLPYQSAKKLT